MTTLSNLLRLSKLLQPICCRRIGVVRYLFQPAVLGLDRFQFEKETVLKTLGPQKELFLRQIKEAVWNEDPIFTKDFRVLILLAETEEEIQLAFDARNLYKKQQKESLFPGMFRHAELLLQMLYHNQRLEQAFSWFQDERTTIVHDAANVSCFMLVMDMLHQAGRYDDVISLMANVDVYMAKPHISILVSYFAALFKKNTATSLSQAVSRLQDCCEKQIPLPSRCLFYTTLLAYNQKQVVTMMEILELPIFYVSTKRGFSISDNISLLGYIELGRLEECIGALKGLLMNMTAQKRVVFVDTISKLSEAVEAKGNAELMVEFRDLKRALERADVIIPQNLAEHVDRDIGEREFSQINWLASPKNRMAMKGFELVAT